MLKIRHSCKEVYVILATGGQCCICRAALFNRSRLIGSYGNATSSRLS